METTNLIKLICIVLAAVGFTLIVWAIDSNFGKGTALFFFIVGASWLILDRSRDLEAERIKELSDALREVPNE